METGFSTYDLSPSQTHQEQFVNEAIDEVLLKRDSHNRDYPLNSLLLVSWYELIDACTKCIHWPIIEIEDRFGILTSDPLWGQKAAYDDLRYQVSRWK